MVVMMMVPFRVCIMPLLLPIRFLSVVFLLQSHGLSFAFTTISNTETFQSSLSTKSITTKTVPYLTRQAKNSASSTSTKVSLKRSFRKSTARSASTARTFVRDVYDRYNGQRIMEESLMPTSEYDIRMDQGRTAQGLNFDNDNTNDGTRSLEARALSVDDPRLKLAYAEFPFSSFDALLDLAFQQYQQNNINNNYNYNVNGENEGQTRSINLVDIGSGCGRLVLYAALTRGSEEKEIIWNVDGIEIGEILHSSASNYLARGIDLGLFELQQRQEQQQMNNKNSIQLHHGPAATFANDILANVDIIFTYSTVFTAEQFSPDLGALLLGPEWSQLLGENCKNGCIAVTTDRALDPRYGWDLVDRLEVENPDVYGSTGYVHVLRK